MKIGFWKGRSGSHIIYDGASDAIDVVSLDSVIEEKATFIKMGIESVELETLNGRHNIIKRFRPKLAICAYHKKEDIIEIPQYIKSLVSEYHLYLRHYSNGASETVLYAIP